MRKLISYVLIFCLIFAMSMTASAATTGNSDSKVLETAINTVKSIVAIPAEYTSFSQSSYENDVNGVKTTVWNLNWSHPQGKGSVSASVDENGNILNFYQYTYRDSTPGISTYTASEGKQVATDFLKKVLPAYADQMKEVPDPYSGSSYPSDSFQYTFKLFKNNLPVDFITATIAVDKFTKEVTSFYNSNGNGNNTDYTYKDASDLITKEEAAAAYLKNIGLDIEYFSYYNDKSQKMTAFAAYVLNGNTGKVIDAKTGKPVYQYTDNNYGSPYYSRGDMGGSALESSVNRDTQKEKELTPQEQTAVDDMASLISKADAEKIARQILDLSSSVQVNSVSLYSDYYYKTNYIWSIFFNDKGSVTINARTGEVTDFYTYADVGKGSQDLKPDAAKKIADAFLQKMCPEKFAQTKYINNSYYFALPIDAKASDVVVDLIPNKVDDTTYYFTYTRQVSGLNFGSNALSVNIDKTTGKIISYNQAWYEDIQFPAVDSALSKEDAFQIFDKLADYAVSYKLTGAKEASPVYDFSNKDSFMIQPETGVRLDWRGQPYQANAPAYQDIQGHWAEEIILSLAENGYYLNSGGKSFNPDSNINQLDFFLYCYSPSAMYSDVDSFYDMLIQNKIITEKEKDPKADVTRQDAAKYIARIMGFEKIASKPELFVYPFKDSVPNSYKGYITIASGLKIMNGNAKGNFNGTKTITNAEAAAIVYNYLQVK